MQIFPAFFFFDILSKLRVVQIRKKIRFLKTCLNDFHKILQVYSTVEPQQYDTIGYSRKILETKKKMFFLISYLSPSVATKATD